jgi:hypothetical protein
MIYSIKRQLSVSLIAPILAVTGFRFSKDYRYGTTRYHRVVYSLICTVAANIAADQAVAS